MAGIPLVEEGVLQEFLKAAKRDLIKIKEKKKFTRIDALAIEYLRTFINNPTPGNYFLMHCGRADKMIRKEETKVKLIQCDHCGGMFEVLYKASNFVCAHCYIGFNGMPEVKWAKDEPEGQDDTEK